MKYRKKPVVIEAMQINTLDYDGMCEIARWCGGRAIGENDSEDDDCVIAIDTLEGTMKAKDGDFIIQGVQGEFYTCRPDIFAATYEFEML
jgi:hypothetical protein